MRAYDALYMDVASYYRSACSLDEEKKTFMTDLPPIYFQHQGMSCKLCLLIPTRSWNSYVQVIP